MERENYATIFLSSTLDNPGEKYHSYRRALKNLIESEYPFIKVHLFEDTASSTHTRRWESEKIKDSVLLIAVIFKDSDEVMNEIRTAINFRYPILLFFYPKKDVAENTWKEFALNSSIKAKIASNWKDLIESIRLSIDAWLINMMIANKGKQTYEPPQAMENIGGQI